MIKTDIKMGDRPKSSKGKHLKEYSLWKDMLLRATISNQQAFIHTATWEMGEMNWKSEIEQRKIEAEFRRKKQLAEVATVLIIGMIAVGVVLASWIHYA
jgi:uncharacterized protein (DUF2062 family)